MRVRIGIVGYGTIGKRVADAVEKQDDMEVVGVVKTKPDFLAEIAVEKGFKLYVPSESIKMFEKRGIDVAGTVEDLVKQSDIVIDSSPAGIGIRNKQEYYIKYSRKAVFQGGEKPEVAEVSFSTLANYEKALGKAYVRVVSCNTTALCRVISAFLLNNIKVRKVRATIVRRAADPHEYTKGPINSIVPDPVTIPSHHAHDVNTVIQGIEIVTAAVIVPVTLMHLHIVNMEFEQLLTKRDVVNVLERTPRIRLINSEVSGIKSTSQLIEWARDIGRIRYDIPELIVFEDSITVMGRELYLIQAVHQEAIVVPENIDAIRAMLMLEKDMWRCIEKTDKALNISKRVSR